MFWTSYYLVMDKNILINKFFNIENKWDNNNFFSLLMNTLKDRGNKIFM